LASGRVLGHSSRVHSAQAVQPPVRESGTRHYKYYDLLLGSFVAVLLCSNLIGPGKACALPCP
jgi:hypothetical protein